MTQIEGDNRYRQSAVALADADIPAAIARDAEVTNAFATHVSATRLEDSTPIKIKLIQGTTAAAQGQSAIIPHGLDFNKILSAQVVVRSSPSLVPVAFQNGSGTSGGFRFNWAIVQGDLYIHNVQGESVGLLSRPVLALITYLA